MTSVYIDVQYFKDQINKVFNTKPNSETGKEPSKTISKSTAVKEINEALLNSVRSE